VSPPSLRALHSRQLVSRRPVLPGQLGFADVPVQVPRLNPITLGTVGQTHRTLQVEDGEALGALGDGLQVEGVDRVGVPADLADEALPLTEDAGQDVFPTEAGGVA
jgi:hypothetical protein